MIMLPMQCHTKQVTKDRKYGASICYKEVENSEEITKSIPNFRVCISGVTSLRVTS